jgi:hypothetical protein
MRIQTSVRRLVLVGAAAAAIAAPSAGAAPGKYVQIGGDLVTPTQLSAYQASADAPVGAHLVQIGGELVRPERLSAYQAHAADVTASKSSSDDDGFGWTSTGFELGLIGSLLLAAGLLGVLWRRGRLSTV